MDNLPRSMIWDFNLRQLRAFIAVVDYGSVSRAAEQLCITQPAVSKVIRAMERSLDFKLFERSGRNIKLTRTGEIFYSHARAAMAEIEAGTAAVDAFREDTSELIRVSAVPAMMSSLIPRAIALLNARRPGTQIIMEGEAYHGIADILSALVSGAVDLGITVYQEEFAEGMLTARKLLSDQLVVFARPDHPLAQQGSVETEELLGEIIVLPPLDTLAGRILIQEFSAVGLPFPKNRIIAASREFTFGLVRECNAVAFLTDHPAYQDSELHDLIRLPVRLRQPVPWSICLCQRKNTAPSPAMQDFIDCLQVLVREAEEGWPVVK